MTASNTVTKIDRNKMEVGIHEFVGFSENSPSNIMYANRDRKITYVNPKSLETLQRIAQYLPVPVDQVLGSSIDIFHKNPNHQKNILADDKNLPHRALIKVGPEILDLQASAVYDQAGEYIGAQVNWDIVTEKIRLEEEVTRTKNMMDNAPFNVMYADRDFNITYLNPKSLETLRKIEQYLPVSVDKMLGSSIDIFHKNPSHQRRILSDPHNLPHKAIIGVGPEKLELLVSAIYNQNNDYIGTMVTWDIVTEKIRLENEMIRMQNMIENTPTNIMMADLNYRLVYMNPTSIKTLKTIEQYLPKPVDQLVGESIDIFHKNPAHQRALLADDKNLPHNARIKLGPEILDLLVSAVYDQNKNYIGMQVTWDVVTTKVKMEEEMARIQDMMKNAPINIMYADLNFNITYVNPKSLETLKKIEQYLPVSADNIVGSNIDIFHKNPSHQRRMLSDPSNLPHRALITVGPEKLDLMAAAIYNSKGDHVGTMVTWDIVTERVKSETEMARMKNMIENAPVNIMMADRDFRLVYINPESMNTLKKIQHLLPKPAEQLLGESIDIFHKNPAHQRRIVGDPSNLPHLAKIHLGDQVLELNVSAIFDNQQNYLGAMVVWNIITDKINLHSSLKDAAQQLSASAEELNATVEEMLRNADITSRQSQSATDSADVVANGVNALSASAEEMRASIKEISRNSSSAAEMSKKSKDQAEGANRSIEKLGTSSQDIGNVIKVISMIAQQTNLLALNATIEAARAGDAGRGFSVVANEVKELANQTSQATEEITQKISAIQQDSQEAIDAIKFISEGIEQLSEISGSIATAVEEQSATTNEVFRVIQDSNTGVQNIADNVKMITDSSKTTSISAQQIKEAADSLAKLSTVMQKLVSDIEL